MVRLREIKYKKKIKIVMLFILFISITLEANTRALKKIYESENRIALVIGNNNYTHKRLGTLQNPINDARAMKKALKKLGFSVYYGENLTVRDMDKKVSKFSRALRHGGVGLFFFAGHGIESQGQNYLMGTNSNIDDEDDVSYESLELKKVLQKMQNSGNRLNIVLLDGNGKNGVFTVQILKNIDRVGVPIEKIFKDVKVGVLHSTHNRQRPWTNSDITQNIMVILPELG